MVSLWILSALSGWGLLSLAKLVFPDMSWVWQFFIAGVAFGFIRAGADRYIERLVNDAIQSALEKQQNPGRASLEM